MPSDPDQFDFFVSYARNDNADGWVTRFIAELLAEHAKFAPDRPLKPFFDKQDIRSLDNWQQRIFNDGLAKSRLFVAFISPNYFASEWCRREWKAWIDTEIAKHILSAGAAPIYLVEVPGFVGKVSGLREQKMLGEQEVARQVAELCGLPAPHDRFIVAASPIVRQMRERRQVTADFVKPFADEGIAALRREDLRKVLEQFARDLDERTNRVRQAAESETTVPPYNKKFSGRLEELLALRERLKDDRAGVISGVHGLGGIGKTELAFTYAHAFASAYPGGRFLVPCEGKTNLRDAALALGDLFRDRIRDEERKTVETYFAAITACLRERLDRLGHTLLVLDNVTDPALLTAQQTDCLTALGPKLHLLATTRLAPPAGAKGNWLTLGELPEADALDLLEKHRPFASDAERDAARRIVKRLGGFALAVELVAAWLAAHEQSSSYAKLADGLGLEDLEVIAGEEDVQLRRHNHERRLTAVLGPVLADLKPAERRTLEYAALLPSDCVPLPWLKILVTRDLPELAQPGRLADRWMQLCERLIQLALLARAGGDTIEPHLVRVHRLVQSVTIRKFGPLTTQSEIERLVSARISNLSEKPAGRDEWWEFEPLIILAGLWWKAGNPIASGLSSKLGQCLAAFSSVVQSEQRMVESEPMLRRLLAVSEQTFGSDHPIVATSLQNLASFFSTTKAPEDAEALLRRALEIEETASGADHPNVARILNDLAGALHATNRLTEAETLYRRAFQIDERAYGPEHPICARDLNNLAQLMHDTNRLAEAEPLIRRALAIDEQVLGRDHPNVAIRLNNLAALLQATNRLAEAEPLMRRALAIGERSFGSNHPNVAGALNNLAQLLQATNRLAEAEPLMRRALAIDESSYAPNHPGVAGALNNLAQLLRSTNRVAEAEPLMRRALAIAEASFGPEHPDVAVRLNNLAQLLQSTNRLAEAEPLMRRALAIDEASFGPQHPDVARDLNNLAQLFQSTNRVVEAEPLMRRALAIAEASFGPDHPDIAVRLNNLAQVLQSTDRLAEAEPLMRRVVEILLKFTQATGHQHPHLKDTVENYAALLQQMGRSPQEVLVQLNAVGQPFGIRLGG